MAASVAVEDGHEQPVVHDFLQPRPLTHHCPGKKPGEAGRFLNPWKSFQMRTTWDTISTIPFMKSPVTTTPPPQVEIDWEKVRNPPVDEVQVTWLGHAAFFVQMDDLCIVTDPALSERCSPSQWFGPKRYSPAAVLANEIPKDLAVDVVVISHCHYDHLDHTSIVALAERGVKYWFVPLGTAPWMAENTGGRGQVVELDWWQYATLPNGVRLMATPAQHFANRSLTDRGKL